MRKPLPLVLPVALGAVLALSAMAVPAADKAADDAKAYQAALDSMKGQEMSKIIDKLRGWKFEGLDSWTAQSPTSKDVSKHNRGKVKFSSQEYKDIFGPGGNFRVIVYNKLVGTDAANIGEVDQYGMSVNKDAKINLEIFTVIRAVFLDDKMIHSRVWPKLEQSAFSGGTWLKR
jgi:hypothetical protein